VSICSIPETHPLGAPGFRMIEFKTKGAEIFTYKSNGGVDFLFDNSVTGHFLGK
jgi:hypothetical protein